MKYRVLQKIMLGFTTPREQYDSLILPGDILETDPEKGIIYLIVDGERKESNNTFNTIDYFLSQKYIEPIESIPK